MEIGSLVDSIKSLSPQVSHTSRVVPSLGEICFDAISWDSSKYNSLNLPSKLASFLLELFIQRHQENDRVLKLLLPSLPFALSLANATNLSG